jgi:hypothetical protein
VLELSTLDEQVRQTLGIPKETWDKYNKAA